MRVALWPESWVSAWLEWDGGNDVRMRWKGQKSSLEENNGHNFVRRLSVPRKDLRAKDHC